MFLEKKIKLSYRQLEKLVNIMSQFSPNDEILSYLFTMNISAISSVLEPFHKKIYGINLKYAAEKDGRIVKTKEGGFEYTKKSQEKMIIETEKEYDKDVEVCFTQLDISSSKAAKELAPVFKAALIGTVLTYDVSKLKKSEEVQESE